MLNYEVNRSYNVNIVRKKNSENWLNIIKTVFIQPWNCIDKNVLNELAICSQTQFETNYANKPIYIKAKNTVYLKGSVSCIDQYKVYKDLLDLSEGIRWTHGLCLNLLKFINIEIQNCLKILYLSNISTII